MAARRVPIFAATAATILSLVAGPSRAGVRIGDPRRPPLRVRQDEPRGESTVEFGLGPVTGDLGDGPGAALSFALRRYRHGALVLRAEYSRSVDRAPGIGATANLTTLQVGGRATAHAANASVFVEGVMGAGALSTTLDVDLGPFAFRDQATSFVGIAAFAGGVVVRPAGSPVGAFAEMRANAVFAAGGVAYLYPVRLGLSMLLSDPASAAASKAGAR